jgi:non-specific serine/threonine protein kinase
MRDTIAWSYDLLSPDEQQLFRCLAVFVGGFTLEAAEEVCSACNGHALDVPDGVGSVLDKSLLRHVANAPDEPRFEMLETVREYGLEQLAASGEEAAVRERHAAFFRDLAARARSAWIAADYAPWLDRLEAERGNVRAALGWAVAAGRAEFALGLAVETNRFWRVHGPVVEGVAWLERALALPAMAPVGLRAAALEVAGDLAQVAGDATRALALTAEAEALARDLGDMTRLELVLAARGRAWFLVGEPEQAAACLEEALALARGHGWNASVASNLSNLGVASRMLGDADRAVALLEEALALAEAQGFAYIHATTTMSLADAVRDTGDVVRAAALYRDGLRLGLEQHAPRIIANALAGCAVLAAACGQAERAARLGGAAAAVIDRAGSHLGPGGQANYDEAVAVARAALGEARFATAWNAGCTLTPEQAIAAGPVSPPDARPLDPATHQVLSSRELEIVRLIAEGRSDREIGEALFISRRTVNAHVANILGKLGASSRWQAVRQAQDLGLL